MCGLVGVAGNLNSTSLKFFKNALIWDYLRGVHSTGLASIKQSEISIRKHAIDPISFLDMGRVDSEISVNSMALIGHNRQATVGAKTSGNAHPFHHGDIVLAHNGTLDTGVKYQLERRYQAPTFGTDSELICWLLDNYETEGILKELEGAFALTWWDDGNTTLNFVNNGERPFSYVVTDKQVYWASERAMLFALLVRNDIWEKDMEIVSPPIGRLDSFSYTGGKINVQCTQLKVAEKKPLPSTTTSGGRRATTGTNRNLPAPVNREPADMGKWRANAAAEFEKKYGYRLADGDTIYAYVDPSKVRTAGYAMKDGVQHCELELTLAGNPYCPVRIYYTPLNRWMSDDKLMGVKLKFTTLSKDKEGGFYIIASNNPKNMEPVETKSQVDAMDAWADITNDGQPPFSEDDTASTYEVQVDGYNGESLTYQKFQRILDRGCCICGDTLDASSEVLDRTVHFVAARDVVCHDCDNLTTLGEFDYDTSHLTERMH